jgi:hypothetical protein
MLLGPVNDLTGAVQAGTLIPVAVAVRQLMPDDPGVDRWTAVGIPAMAGASVLPVLLVVQVLPFPVQAPMVTVCIVVMYGWVVAVSRAGRRHGVWPRALSTAGTATGIGLAACFAAAVLAWALPAGSAARYGAAATAGVAGAVAWLGFPAWTLLLGRVLRRTSDIPT